MDIDQVQEIIGDIYNGAPTEALTSRVAMLYDLAGRIDGSDAPQIPYIVELGTYHGYGAFALALGRRDNYALPVYTIDDYKDKTGWAGEHYGPKDKEIFWINAQYMRANHGLVCSEYDNRADDDDIVQIQEDVVRVGHGFMLRSVGLLYLDIGSDEHVDETFWAWHESMMVGGIVAMRDTINRATHCDVVADGAVKSGKYKSMPSPDRYFILLEKVAE